MDQQHLKDNASAAHALLQNCEALTACLLGKATPEHQMLFSEVWRQLQPASGSVLPEFFPEKTSYGVAAQTAPAATSYNIREGPV